MLKNSKKAVVDRLKQLEAKGVITLPKGKRERAIQMHYVHFRAEWTREKNPELRRSRWKEIRGE